MASDKQLDALTQDAETRAILQDKGYIDERMVNELAARQTGEKLRQEQAAQLAAESAAAVQTPLGRQEAQQGADTLEAAALQGTGINPGFQPIQQPRFAETPNLSPQPMDFTGMPSTLQKPVGDVIAAETAAATEQMAKQTGQQIAVAEQARRQEEIATKSAKQSARTEESVKKDLESSNSNVLRNIGDFVAIMVGAAAQAYGAKENPGVEAIESRIKAESEKRKYNMEQEQALRKLALDAARLKLDQMNAMTDNQYKKAQIASLYGKLEMEKAAAEQSNLTAQMLNRPDYTYDELFAVQGEDGAKLRKIAVPHPFERGKYIRVASGPEAADTLRKFLGETGAAVPTIDDIISTAQSVDYSKLSPEDRVKMDTKLGTLAGSLRLAILGPGPMTDDERKFLKQIIGDPNTLTSLASWQVARLKEVKENLKTRILNQYENVGNIYLGEYPDDTKINNIVQRTGISKEMAQKAYDLVKQEKSSRKK